MHSCGLERDQTTCRTSYSWVGPNPISQNRHSLRQRGASSKPAGILMNLYFSDASSPLRRHPSRSGPHSVVSRRLAIRRSTTPPGRDMPTRCCGCTARRRAAAQTDHAVRQHAQLRAGRSARQPVAWNRDRDLLAEHRTLESVAMFCQQWNQLGPDFPGGTGGTHGYPAWRRICLLVCRNPSTERSRLTGVAQREQRIILNPFYGNCG